MVSSAADLGASLTAADKDKFSGPRQIPNNSNQTSSKSNSRPSSGGTSSASASASIAAAALSSLVLNSAVQILSRDSIETIGNGGEDDDGSSSSPSNSYNAEDTNVRVRVRKISAQNPRAPQPTTPPPSSMLEVEQSFSPNLIIESVTTAAPAPAPLVNPVSDPVAQAQYQALPNQEI